MKKYMIVALMPFLFQSIVCGKDRFADLDQMLMPQLQAARAAINSSIKLELESIVHALVVHGKKSSSDREIAIQHIVLIQKFLQSYRSAEIKKLTWLAWAVGSNTQKVVDEIDPALKKVNQALKDLKVTSSEYSIAAKGFLAVALVALAATAGFSVGKAIKNWGSSENQSDVKSDKDNGNTQAHFEEQSNGIYQRIHRLIQDADSHTFNYDTRQIKIKSAFEQLKNSKNFMTQGDFDALCFDCIGAACQIVYEIVLKCEDIPGLSEKSKRAIKNADDKAQNALSNANEASPDNKEVFLAAASQAVQALNQAVLIYNVSCSRVAQRSYSVTSF